MHPPSSERLRRADVKINSRKAAERAIWLLRNGGFGAGLEDIGAPRDIVRQIKAAVAGGTTSGDMAALAELRMQSEALTSTVASVGFFDALRGDAIEGEFFARYAAALVDPIAGEVIEGRGVRVTQMAFDSRTLRERAVSSIIVLSKELLRFGTAVGVIEILMRRAIARATDAAVVPELLAGAPSVAASGPGSDEILHDLRRGLGALPSGADAKFRVGVGPALAKRLALMPSLMGSRAFPEMTPTGGVLAGIPCSVSEALGADVILTDGTAIVATGADIELDQTEHATLEMDTAPTNASNDAGVPAASTLVSLFQAGGVAMKVTRRFDWSAVRLPHTVQISGAGNLWGLELVEGSPDTLG